MRARLCYKHMKQCYHSFETQLSLVESWNTYEYVFTFLLSFLNVHRVNLVQVPDLWWVLEFLGHINWRWLICKLAHWIMKSATGLRSVDVLRCSTVIESMITCVLLESRRVQTVQRFSINLRFCFVFFPRKREMTFFSGISPVALKDGVRKIKACARTDTK